MSLFRAVPSDNQAEAYRAIGSATRFTADNSMDEQLQTSYGESLAGLRTHITSVLDTAEADLDQERQQTAAALRTSTMRQLDKLPSVVDYEARGEQAPGTAEAMRQVRAPLTSVPMPPRAAAFQNDPDATGLAPAEYLEPEPLAPVGPTGRNVQAGLATGREGLGRVGENYQEQRGAIQRGLDTLGESDLLRPGVRSAEEQRQIDAGLADVAGGAVNAATDIVGNVPQSVFRGAAVAAGLPNRQLVPGITGETPVLGGLTNPAELAATVGSAALPAMYAERVIGGLVGKVARPVLGAAGQALRRGAGAVADVADNVAGAVGREGAEAPVFGVRAGSQGADAIKPGQRLPREFVYHNTRSEYVDAIEREGMSAGSFGDKPIDFGGDVWIATRKSVLPDVQEHQYGNVWAYEPNYTIGEDAAGFPIEKAIPATELYLVDKRGRVIRQLGAATPPKAEAPALGIRAGEEASGIAAGTRRAYHGTGTTFDTPDPSKFDPNGLYGPGYYLTDEPRVAASYAEGRSGLDGVMTLRNRVRQLEGDLARPGITQNEWFTANDRLDDTLRELEDVEGRVRPAQMRPVDVPPNANLLDTAAPLTSEQLEAVLVIPDLPPLTRVAVDALYDRPEPIGRHLWEALASNDLPTARANAQRNALLSAAGFDGLRYPGGDMMPILDSTTGRAIKHNAYVIFPESLPKITNALTGQPGGIVAGATPAANAGADLTAAAQRVARSNLMPGAAATQGQAAADLGVGAAAGVYGAATAPEDATWQERLARGAEFGVAGTLAPGAVRGLAGAARGGLRRAAGRTAGIIADVEGTPAATAAGTLLSRTERLAAGGEMLLPKPKLSVAGEAFRKARIDAIAKPLVTGKGLSPSEATAQATARVDDFITRLQRRQAIPPDLLSNEERAAWLQASDILGTYMRVNMLASPLTHIRNITGTAATIPYQLGERLLSTPLEWAFRKAGYTSEARYSGEAPQMARGYLHSLTAATQNFLDIMRHGDDLAEAAQTGTAPRGKIATTLGKAFRPLTATDAFFKTIYEGGELYAQAYRAARQQSLKGAALDTEVLRLVQQPTPAMLKAVEQAGKYHTFNQDLDKVGEAIGAIGKVPVIGPTILPFYRTPYNAIKYDLERSPLGLVSVIKAGATKGTTSGEMADRLARTIMGSTIATALYLYARDGNVTAGLPSNPSERDAWQAEGKTPYSIRIGGRWWQVGLLPGMQANLILAANAAKLGKEVGETGKGFAAAAGQMALELVNAIAQKPLLDTLTGLLGAIDRPETAGQFFERYAASAGGSLLPASSTGRYVQNIVDENRRAPESLADRLASNYPGLAGQVPVMRDQFGRPLKKTQTGWEAALNPFRASQETTGLRRYRGSQSAEQDTRITQAIGRVDDWNRDRRGFPEPSAADKELARQFKGREDSQYTRLRREATVAERQAALARLVTGGR